MPFTVQYRSDDHDLVRVYNDGEDVQTGEGLETKTFPGTVDGLTWNPESLSFAPTPTEPAGYAPAPDATQQLADLQEQMDALTEAFAAALGGN